MKLLIVFNNMIADMETKKTLRSTVTELFLKDIKLEN